MGQNVTDFTARFCYNVLMLDMNLKKGKILAALLATGLLLGGCGVDREAQRAARDEGIKAMVDGDYKAAVKDFNRALQQAGAWVTEREVNISYYKAAAQVLGGDYGGAVNTYSNLIDFDKNNAYAYFLRGSAYLKSGDKENGLADYRSAVGVSPEDYELHMEIYGNLSESGYDKEAAEFLNLALEIAGDSAENYLYRGQIYMLLDQYEVAKTTLQKSVDKGSMDAKVYLANVYHALGDDESANKLIDEYIGEESVSPDSLATAGNLLLEQGRYEDALGVFRRGLEMNNVDNPRALLKGEIVALEYTGQFAEARQKANDYIAAYPSDADIIRELVFLNTR